ncbi:1-acyl-sn-glycerol-3-phosphate acyltransferase [Atopobacter sp. AH10]|uniref:lysophospholipid acyltransferase family protein n=1 Tax=Atopobacter sp. AH10 TaxID=2315861 RepID=UPI000EF2545C|nr:lysophospholipid acyltransferase family protein [Atopobacter sp. AH10]RLK62512.1 1-acyl-sn-glycerol-3-phosphate acyltransferase [Atopobacter sp. AH10]
MFFRVVLFILKCLVLSLNGRIKVVGKENIPSSAGYIIAAPHHSWLDPVAVAIAADPKRITAMAKVELFNFKPLGFILRNMGAFPVNRAKPGPSAIKIPVQRLKEDQATLIIFPSGTRHASDIKGGTASIARLSKCPILPTVYNGPLSLKDFLLRRPMTVIFDKPFYVKSKEDQANFAKHLDDVYSKIDENHHLIQ